MRKIDSLCATLRAAIPEAASDPAALRVWIDRGQAQARQTSTSSFTMIFRLNVLAKEISTDLSLITLAVTRWMRTNHPDLLQPGKDSFSFDADILDNGTADVLVQIDLTQDYQVTVVDGVERVEAVEQNDPVLDELASAAGPGLTPEIEAILLGGEQLVPPPDAPF